MRNRKTAISPEDFSIIMRSHFFLLSAGLLLVIGVSARPLLSENHKPIRHAIIFGTVWGPDDQELPDMEVKMRLANQKKAHWDLYSNRRGEFEVAVPAGPADYVIWAVTKHYKLRDGKHLQPSPEVTVHIDSDERADTGLHLK